MAAPQPVSPEAVRAFAMKYPKALRALENLVRTLISSQPQHALQALNVTRRALAYLTDPESASACAPCSGSPLLLDSMSACMAATVREVGGTGGIPFEGSCADGDVASVLLFLQTGRDFNFESNQVVCQGDDSLCSFGTAHNASVLDLTEQSLTLRSQSSIVCKSRPKKLRRQGSESRSSASSAPTFGTQPSLPTPPDTVSAHPDGAFSMWSSMYNLACTNSQCADEDHRGGHSTPPPRPGRGSAAASEAGTSAPQS